MKIDRILKHESFISSGALMTTETAKYNCRAKLYPQADGSLKLVEEMACSRFIFNPDGVEEHVDERKRERLDYYYEMEVLQGQHKKHVEYKRSPADNVARSKRRAKNKLYDLIGCNNFDYFVTLTLSPDKIDRKDYAAIIKKLNAYLDNRVRRNGLKYVGVPETHKDGSFHFHFLCNDVLPLVHSGTYITPDGGRPVKAQTVAKRGFELSECKDVYNVKDWFLGFTTAIRTYGAPEAVAHYVGKYITKGDNKIGGRWYYSGGNLARPLFKYYRVSFNDFAGDYGFLCDGGAFIVRKDFAIHAIMEV